MINGAARNVSCVFELIVFIEEERVGGDFIKHGINLEL